MDVVWFPMRQIQKNVSNLSSNEVAMDEGNYKQPNNLQQREKLVPFSQFWKALELKWKKNETFNWEN